MTEYTDIHIPPGRWVNGSITETRKKDRNKQIIPEEKQRYEWGIAVPKFVPDMNGQLTPNQHVAQTLATMAQAAKGGYANAPHILQRIDGWFQTMSGFSMKVSDGDQPAQSTGQVNENMKGCYVFWFSSKTPPNVCNSQNIQIDPASVKCGWFFDVAGSVRINELMDNNAGLYLNCNWMRLVAEGEEILGSVDADTAFAATPAQAEYQIPGMRPVGSVPAPGAGMPGGGMPGGAPAPAAPAPAAPAPAGNPTTGAPVPAQTGPVSAPMPVGNNQPTAPAGTAYPPHDAVLNPPAMAMPGLPGT